MIQLFPLLESPVLYCINSIHGSICVLEVLSFSIRHIAFARLQP